MKALKTLIFLMFLMPGFALADTGDRLFVSKPGIFLLYAPGEEDQIIMTLKLDREMVELDREGEWIKVTPIDSKIDGWLHATSLSPTRTVPLPPPPVDIHFEEFKTQIEALNDEVQKLVVGKLYHEVENKGDGVVEITVTNTWLRYKFPERQTNLRYLFYLWEQIQGEETPITIRLVDYRGQLIMNADKE